MIFSAWSIMRLPCLQRWGITIIGTALAWGQDRRCLCQSVLGAHLEMLLVFFVLRCSPWLAAGQPKHGWGGSFQRVLEQFQGLILDFCFNLFSEVYHSPFCAVSSCDEPTHHRFRSEGFFQLSSYCLGLELRFALLRATLSAAILCS